MSVKTKTSKLSPGLKKAWSIFPLRLGLIFLALLLLLAIFGPMLQPYDPWVLNDQVLAPPGKEHLLGSDQYGRDLLSRILNGTRTSLIVGFIAAGISAVIGTVVGAVSGYFGGKFDQVLTFIINIFDMTPTFFLILIVIALFGGNIINMMVVIGLTTWTSNARLMRTQAVSLKQRNFVKGAQTIGEGTWRILFRHVLPNGIYPIIVNTTMNISGAILTEAGLAFLGLGDRNIISWGQIIAEGRGFISNGWWVSTFPGLATVFCVWTFFLLGDGLNRLLTPKLQKLQ